MKATFSLTARLGLLYAGSMAFALLVVGLLFEQAIEEQFQKRDLEELNGKLEVVRDTLGNIASYEAVGTLPLQLHNTLTAGHPYSSITIVGSDGTALLTMGQPGVVDLLVEAARTGAPQPVTWSLGKRAYRTATDRVALGIPGSQAAHVAITFDISSDQDFLTTVRARLRLGIALASVASGLVGWMVVRKGLSPLRTVSGTLANISSSHLDSQIPTAGVPRDLQGLILAFNKMLARLDDSFKRLSEFSSDIAHELRTPINNMMLQTQVALSHRRDVEEYCAILQSNLEELRRLSRMIEDMLFLANADNRLLAPQLESTDLHTEVAKLLDFFGIAASEHRVSFALSGEAPMIFADRLMIQRAISNLLSNALRFTPPGSTIGVEIRQTAKFVSIAVVNCGPPIAPEQLSKIFDRLYRADASRREGSTSNVGLGLAIAKSIVEMHEGSISVESAGDVTRFTITLPRKPEASIAPARDEARRRVSSTPLSDAQAPAQ